MYKNNPFFWSEVKSANAWPHTSSGPVWKLRIGQIIDMHGDFFVWCSLRKRNWRLNSGLKSATIVTDPLMICPRRYVNIINENVNNAPLNTTIHICVVGSREINWKQSIVFFSVTSLLGLVGRLWIVDWRHILGSWTLL